MNAAVQLFYCSLSWADDDDNDDDDDDDEGASMYWWVHILLLAVVLRDQTFVNHPSMITHTRKINPSLEGCVGFSKTCNLLISPIIS